jgi:hypothetical protein
LRSSRKNQHELLRALDHCADVVSIAAQLDDANQGARSPSPSLPSSSSSSKKPKSKSASSDDHDRHDDDDDDDDDDENESSDGSDKRSNDTTSSSDSDEDVESTIQPKSVVSQTYDVDRSSLLIIEAQQSTSDVSCCRTEVPTPIVPTAAAVRVVVKTDSSRFPFNRWLMLIDLFCLFVFLLVSTTQLRPPAPPIALNVIIDIRQVLIVSTRCHSCVMTRLLLLSAAAQDCDCGRRDDVDAMRRRAPSHHLLVRYVISFDHCCCWSMFRMWQIRAWCRLTMRRSTTPPVLHRSVRFDIRKSLTIGFVDQEATAIKERRTGPCSFVDLLVFFFTIWIIVCWFWTNISRRSRASSNASSNSIAQVRRWPFVVLLHRFRETQIVNIATTTLVQTVGSSSPKANVPVRRAVLAREKRFDIRNRTTIATRENHTDRDVWLTLFVR